MRKIILFLIVLLLLPSVNALYDKYVICQNSTLDDAVASIVGLRFNGTQSMHILHNAGKRILLYNKTSQWDNYENITIDKRITEVDTSEETEKNPGKRRYCSQYNKKFQCYCFQD